MDENSEQQKNSTDSHFWKLRYEISTFSMYSNTNIKYAQIYNMCVSIKPREFY